MRRDRWRAWVLVGVACAAAVLGAVGLAVDRPASALAAQSTTSATSGPALVLSSDPPGTVHGLAPDVPTPWNVGVTVRRMPVSTLVGIVTSQGGFDSAAGQVPASVELLGCSQAWVAMTCASGERVILPQTDAAALTGDPAALTDPTRPIPAQVWVQARVTLAADAPQPTVGQLDVRLTVDASGADSTAPPAPGTGGSSVVGSGPSSVAETGSSVLGPALLAVAAVTAGLAIVGFVRRRRHG